MLFANRQQALEEEDDPDEVAQKDDTQPRILKRLRKANGDAPTARVDKERNEPGDDEELVIIDDEDEDEDGSAQIKGGADSSDDLDDFIVCSEEEEELQEKRGARRKSKRARQAAAGGSVLERYADILDQEDPAGAPLLSSEEGGSEEVEEEVESGSGVEDTDLSSSEASGEKSDPEGDGRNGQLYCSHCGRRHVADDFSAKQRHEPPADRYCLRCTFGGAPMEKPKPIYDSDSEAEVEQPEVSDS